MRSGVRLTPAVAPMTKDPSMLISNVPQGNRAPISAATAPVIQNRATLPSAPPTATAAHVVGPAIGSLCFVSSRHSRRARRSRVGRMDRTMAMSS